MTLFYVVDTSGSMYGSKIQSVNAAMEETMEDDFFAPKEMSEMVCASFLTALGRTPVIARTKDPAEREQILDQLYDNYTKDIFEAVEALGIKMKSCVELKNMAF